MNAALVTEASVEYRARMNGFDDGDALRAAIEAGDITDDDIAEARAERATRAGTGAYYVDLANLHTNKPPPREWIVDNWLARGVLTLCAGEPGAGKTFVMQQLAAGVARGRRTWDATTTRGAVLLWACEDDADELRRRQVRIDDAAGIQEDDPHEGLFIAARVGCDNVLAVPGPDGKLATTGAFDALEAEIEETGADLVIIDNSATCFGGSENDRAQVTQFCNMLSGLASRHACAVALLSHTAKATGSTYSGSTAWSGAVRARLHLHRRDDGLVELEVLKSNLSALSSVLFEYRDGVFAEVSSGADTQIAREAERAVLSALAKYTGRQEATSHRPRAGSFLPKLMEQDGILGTSTRAACEGALRWLIDQGAIETNAPLGWKNSSRHACKGLRLATRGAA